jgi:hypothetical protein
MAGVPLLLVVGGLLHATVHRWPESVPDTDGGAWPVPILVTTRAWGAIPDDDLDDRPALQAAIDAAKRGPRKTVAIPPGDYDLTGPLYVNGGVRIEGEWRPHGETNTYWSKLRKFQMRGTCPDWVDDGDARGRRDVRYE